MTLNNHTTPLLTAFKKLPQQVKENYGECIKSLQRRFDLDRTRPRCTCKPYRPSKSCPEAVVAVSPQEEGSSTQTVKLLNERLQQLEILLERKGSPTEHRTITLGVSYRVKGVVGVVDIEFIVNTGAAVVDIEFVVNKGAAVSIIRKEVWTPLVKRDNALVLEQYSGKNLWSKPSIEQGVANRLILNERTVVPARSKIELMGVMVANAVVSPNSNELPVGILNPRDEKVVLKKGTQIASMKLLEQDPVRNISTVMKNQGVSLECQNILWEMVSKARREELRALLKDMLESDVIQQTDSQPKTAFTTPEGLYYFKGSGP
eukprot:Em0018g952a